MSIESKTKEQTLKERQLSRLHESNKKGRQEVGDCFDQGVKEGIYDWVFEAMDEHARSRAIDVLRWGASNKLEFLLGVWCDNNTAYDSIEDVINAYELFSHSIDK